MTSTLKQRVRNAIRWVRGGRLEGHVGPGAKQTPDAVQEAIALLGTIAPRDLQRRGYHLQKLDYYSGLNDIPFLEENRDLWHGRGLPRGIAWDLDRQLDNVRRLAEYFGELADVPKHSDPEHPGFHWENDFWQNADAGVQYGLLRDAKPRRVVEVGCGWSSLLMARALQRNAAERPDVPAPVVEQVEPFPRRELLEALPRDWAMHETSLQRAPLEVFERLDRGDVCFYDGSHVARVASDVVWFFFEVLPRLRPGVIVHLHDIFWPEDYPDDWVLERAQTWNEQYVLQAFLMHNHEFEVLVCNSALFAERREHLEPLYAGTAMNPHGGSVWLRRRTNA